MLEHASWSHVQEHGTESSWKEGSFCKLSGSVLLSRLLCRFGGSSHTDICPKWPPGLCPSNLWKFIAAVGFQGLYSFLKMDLSVPFQYNANIIKISGIICEYHMINSLLDVCGDILFVF